MQDLWGVCAPSIRLLVVAYSEDSLAAVEAVGTVIQPVAVLLPTDADSTDIVLLFDNCDLMASFGELVGAGKTSEAGTEYNNVHRRV